MKGGEDGGVEGNSYPSWNSSEDRGGGVCGDVAEVRGCYSEGVFTIGGIDCTASDHNEWSGVKSDGRYI